MTISYTKLSRRVFPSTATLNSQSPPPSQTTTPPSGSPRMLLNYYQRSSFAAPQAAICQPTNLQPRLKSGFEVSPSLAATRASPFSRPSTARPPQRSSPAMASRSCPHPERGDDDGADSSVIRAISSDYAVNAELPAIGTPIRRYRPQGRLTQPNSPPDVLHAVQRARLPHTLAACRHKDEVRASHSAGATAADAQ